MVVFIVWLFLGNSWKAVQHRKYNYCYASLKTVMSLDSPGTQWELWRWMVRCHRFHPTCAVMVKKADGNKHPSNVHWRTKWGLKLGVPLETLSQHSLRLISTIFSLYFVILRTYWMHIRKLQFITVVRQKFWNMCKEIFSLIAYVFVVYIGLSSLVIKWELS